MAWRPESTPIPFTPLRRHLDGALHISRLELRGAEIAQSRVDPDPVAEALYVLEDPERIGYMAWGDDRGSVVKAAFAADLSAYDYVNLNYFFHGFSALEEVTGMANLPGCREMRYAFASCGLTELDLSGFDASQCEDLFYRFAGSDLVTIWADADFAYPEGCSGSGMFYSCDALTGGAGTTYDFSRRNIEYFRIDGGELAPGYLTAGPAV